jgi:steroid 5-alpha reductase family enzyme
MVTTVVASAAAVVVAMVATFAIAALRGRQDTIDTTWGLGFALVAVVSFVSSGGGSIPLTVCTVVWGARLAWHLHTRNARRGEDPRYRAIIADAGTNPTAHLIRKVYLPQAVLLWFVALPVQLGQFGAMTWYGWIGVALWAFGFGFEALGDAQLSRFRADPRNAGKVLDIGLWRYTRHPNYFGDACVWWGLYLVAASTPYGAATVLSPVLMTWLLTKGTGKPLLEKDIAHRRPSYVDYVRRTSGFIPLPPRKERA